MKQTLTAFVTLIALNTLASAPVAAGEWGIGLATMAQQTPQIGADTESLLLPYFRYQGEHLRLDLATIGYAWQVSDTVEIAAIGEFRFDGYDPADSDALTGMAKRRPAFDAGISAAHMADWGILRLDALHDITRTHSGYEFRAAYQYPFQSGPLLLAPSIGVSWQSRSLTNYYYGVRAGEASANRPAYATGAATNVFAELAVSYALGEKFELLGGASYTRLDKGIRRSPVIEHDERTMAFAAVLFKF